MARKLVTIPSGRWAKWVVLAIWLGLLVVAGPLAGKLTDVQENDSASWLPESAESTEVFEQAQRFKGGDTVPTLIVYDRPGGVTKADEAKAAADLQRLKAVEGATGQVTGPVKATGGKALQSIVVLKMPEDGWTGLIDPIKEMRKIAKSGAGGDLGVHVTGPGGYAADAGSIFEQADGTLLYAALGVVIVLLLMTYRSPVLWMVPVIAAVVGLTVSQAIVYLLAKHAGVTVNGQSTLVLAVLVIGAGVDYALLLVARYREELRRHADRHEAMAEALRRCGGAIVASAATVALGLLCLTFAQLSSTKGLGPVCAIGIGVGLLSMMTLFPALLVILGRWVFWPKRPVYGSPEPTQSGIWSKLGQGIARRPRTTWIVTAGVLGLMAFGMLSLKTDGIQNADSYWKNPEAVKGERVAVKHFPPAAGEPMEVITKPGSAAQVAAALKVEGVTAVSQPRVEGGLAYMEGTLAAPASSQKAFDTVERARKAVHKTDSEAKIGGASAILLDTADANSHDRNLIIPLVLAVVFVILGLLLRSLIAPLLLIGTVVLSFAATLGVSALVFEHVFHFAGADQSFPLWTFVFLVALGIDYNIFLMSRVREEAVRDGHRRGSLTGLTATGGVITSAGLVLAGTFSALAAMPMVFVTQLGFAVAFGVLLDTIIVRSVLVTALNLDVGKKMWWPSRLARQADAAPSRKRRLVRT